MILKLRIRTATALILGIGENIDAIPDLRINTHMVDPTLIRTKMQDSLSLIGTLFFRGYTAKMQEEEEGGIL